MDFLFPYELEISILRKSWTFYFKEYSHSPCCILFPWVYVLLKVELWLPLWFSMKKLTSEQWVATVHSHDLLLLRSQLWCVVSVKCYSSLFNCLKTLARQRCNWTESPACLHTCIGWSNGLTSILKLCRSCKNCSSVPVWRHAPNHTKVTNNKISFHQLDVEYPNLIVNFSFIRLNSV